MKATLTIILIFLSAFLFGQIAWINEYHYANNWSDVNEFIEIVVRNTGEWEEAKYMVEFYDGRTGKTYMTKTLNDFIIGDTTDDCLIYYYPFEGDSIQNGTGGFALSYDSVLIDGRTAYNQFISYGGIMIGTQGAAKDKVSHDPGFIQNTTTSPYESIQMTGEHFIWWGFQWTADSMTPGLPNPGQIINEAPMKFIIIDPDTIQ